MKPLTDTEIVAANLIRLADELYREARRLQAGKKKVKGDYKRFAEIVARTK